MNNALGTATKALQVRGADRNESRAILRTMLEADDFPSFLREFPAMGNDPAMRRLYESTQASLLRIVKLQAHAKRTAHANLREYLAQVTHLHQRLIEQPTIATWEALQRHGLHCEKIMGDLLRSRYSDGYALVVNRRLREDLAKDAYAQVAMFGKAGDGDHDSSDLDDEMESKHEAFVKALEKEFKIKAHHWEPIREGLAIFFDLESTKDLLDQIKDYNTALQRVTAEHEYVMLQRGKTDDAVWGDYGTATSKWVFVYCPAGLDSWIDAKSMEKLGTDLEKEAGKRDKALIDEINNLD